MASPLGTSMALLLLAFSSLVSSCSPGQSRDWETSIVSPMLKPPSWPWTCHAHYVWSEDDDSAGLYEHFNITKHQLRQWNCFLRQTKPEIRPNQKLCVDATLGFLQNKAHQEGPQKESQHSSSAHGHATTSESWTGVLDFTTYPVYFSNPALSTEKKPTMRYWTTYPTFVSFVTKDKSDSTTTTPSMRYWTTYATSSTTATARESKESTSTSSTHVRHRSRTTRSHTSRQSQTTPYLSDLSSACASEARTSTTTSAASSSTAVDNLMSRNGKMGVMSNTSGAYGLQPILPAHSRNSIKFSFTGKCDSDIKGAEDCRVTLTCDASLRQYPTCIDGECRCEAMPCSGEAACEPLHQCRSDDEQVSCIPEPYLYPSVEGICQCTARGTGCLYADEPHDFCNRAIACTEKHFSAYPEFPQCVTSDAWLTYPRGRCDCQPVYCKRTGRRLKDEEACEDLISCKGGMKPHCAPKYGDDSKGGDDGYCTCGP